MLCKYLIKQFCIIMERKSHMFYKSLFLLISKPVKTVKLLVYLIMVNTDIMKKIIIKICNACFFSLFVENLISVLKCLYKASMQFCCKRIAFSRMT